MTKQEAISAMARGAKVRHRYFISKEYIFLQDGIIVDERGVKHPNYWEANNTIAHESDWEIFADTLIEIEVQDRRKCVEINSRNSGANYLIDEIELGSGPHKKIMPYTEGLMKKGAQCKAMVILPGKVRIIL